MQPSRKPNLLRIYSSRLLELKFEIVCSKIYIFFQHFPKCRHDPCGVTNPRNTDQLPEGNAGFLQLVKTEQILHQPCPKGAKKWEEWVGTIFFFLVNFQRRITAALHWLPIFRSDICVTCIRLSAPGTGCHEMLLRENTGPGEMLSWQTTLQRKCYGQKGYRLVLLS